MKKHLPLLVCHFRASNVARKSLSFCRQKHYKRDPEIEAQVRKSWDSKASEHHTYFLKTQTSETNIHN
ncbi:hypothetical protein L2E82_29621 [Cichorium intybus]|uniref:Uncharacterized protein n=1 Tax=Cichorium intybus TaxID=13427 RepID=A0ACB9CY19_CICIN|nr:hypothetical protein L2E82_29621 [Cichorium intybus]